MRAMSFACRWVLGAVAVFGAAHGFADDVSHRAAAVQLVEVMHLDKLTNDAIDVMMNAQLESNSDLRPYQDLMRAYLAKYMSWDAMRDKYLDIYVEAYTEPELKGLVEFYKTPLGQKLLASLPQVMQRAADVGRTAVSAHMDELEGQIRARLNGSAAPAPAQAP